MSEQEQTINNDYKEIADCKEIELNGFFVVNRNSNRGGFRYHRG